MRQYFKTRYMRKFWSLLLVFAVVLGSGAFSAVQASAATGTITGYWYFYGNGGELLFSPTGGTCYPHQFNASLNKDMSQWTTKLTFPVTAVRREGYTLSGWNMSEDGTGTEFPNTAEAADVPLAQAGVALYAQWKPNRYDVTWNGNGGDVVLPKYTVPYGSRILSYAPGVSRGDEVKDGYHYSYQFEGWYTQPEGGWQLSTYDTQGIGDADYYAHWSYTAVPLSYTLHFNGNGGSSYENQRIVKRGDSYGSLPGAVRSTEVIDGYTFCYEFLGWYTAASGGEKVTAADVMQASDTTVYAHWKVSRTANKYVLSFDANGGVGSQTSHTVVRGNYYGALPSASRAPVTENGYTASYQFEGWYTAAAGGVQVADETVMQASDTTVYAHWKETKSPIQYRLCFHPNGGDGVMASQQISYGTAVPIRENAYSKTGYRFVGWAYSPSGAKAFDDKEAVRNLTQTDNETISLYAQWEKMSYEVVCLDVVGDKDSEEKKVLGKSTWHALYGTEADGARQGTESAVGAYYSGMQFVSATSAEVTEHGCTVYRYFADFSASRLDGVSLGKKESDGADGETDTALGNVITAGDMVGQLVVSGDSGIKEIADNAFQNSKDTLKSIQFDNATVERIGEYAFAGCAGISSVELPYSVREVGRGAFSGCSGLQQIAFYNPDCEIGEDAIPAGAVVCGFADSSAIEYAQKHQLSYEIINALPAGLFEGETSLEKFTVPKGVKQLGKGAFSGCSALQEIFFEGIDTIVAESAAIPEGTRIKCYAGSKAAEFAEAAGHAAALLMGYETDGLKKLDKKQFAGSDSIVQIVIGDGIGKIEEQCFTDCSKLTEIAVSDSGLRQIGAGAFENCTSLRSFHILQKGKEADPQKINLEYIGDGAFANTALKEFILYNPNCVVENTAKEAYTFPKSTLLRGWSKSTLADYSRQYGNEWNAVGDSYQVDFNRQGGESGTERIYAYTDMEWPDITIPCKSGYSFAGYESDGVVYYDSQGKMLRTGLEIHITNDRIGRSSLTAKWEEADIVPGETDDSKQPEEPEETADVSDKTPDSEINTGGEDGSPDEEGGTAAKPDIDAGTPEPDTSAKPDGEDDGLSAEVPDLDTPEPCETEDVLQSPKPSQPSSPKAEQKWAVKKEGSKQSAKCKKGKVYTVKKLKYKVTALESKKQNQTKKYAGSVSVVGVVGKQGKTIKIPSAVVIRGTRMKVAAVAPKAFMNRKDIKKVSVGTNVKKIGKYAFYHCKNIQIVQIKTQKEMRIEKNAFRNCRGLRKIVIKTSKLKKLGKGAFCNIHPHAILKIPENKVEAYRKLFQRAR